MKSKKPIILGVLNVSPESTNKDSIGINRKSILKRVKFLKKYASIIDIGARSTSGKTKKIDEKTEQSRLLPTIKLLKEKKYIISVDTWSINTAIKCLDYGVQLINFTSSKYNRMLFESIKKHDSNLIITYMPYKNAYIMRRSKYIPFNLRVMINFFKLRINLAKKYGVNKIILDPNLGIIPQIIKNNDYKRINLQVDIINILGVLKKLKCSIMVNLAYRKYHGPIIIMMASLLIKNKVDYIRTHDPDIVNRLLTIKND